MGNELGNNQKSDTCGQKFIQVFPGNKKTWINCEESNSCATAEPQVMLLELTRPEQTSFPLPGMLVSQLLRVRMSSWVRVCGFKILKHVFYLTSVHFTREHLRLSYWQANDAYACAHAVTCFSQPHVCRAGVVTSSKQEAGAPASAILFTGARPSHGDPLFWRHGQVTAPTAVCWQHCDGRNGQVMKYLQYVILSQDCKFIFILLFV